MLALSIHSQGEKRRCLLTVLYRLPSYGINQNWRFNADRQCFNTLKIIWAVKYHSFCLLFWVVWHLFRCFVNLPCHLLYDSFRIRTSCNSFLAATLVLALNGYILLRCFSSDCYVSLIYLSYSSPSIWILLPTHRDLWSQLLSQRFRLSYSSIFSFAKYFACVLAEISLIEV